MKIPFVLLAATVLFASAALAAPDPDMIPAGARNIVNDGKRTEYDIDQAPDMLDKFYRKALLGDGWSSTADVQVGNVVSFYFSRGAAGEGAVVFKPKGNYTHVTLTISE